MSEEPYKPSSFNKAIVFISEGVYLPRKAVMAANRNYTGDIVLGIRHHEGGDKILWNQTALRKKHKPSEDSFEGMITKIKEEEEWHY